MTQRHRYIVQLVDRHTGHESDRTVEAVSAADAQAQMASDPTVYVGTARRADGTAEPFSSPYERLEHMGLDSAEPDPVEPDSEPDRTGFEGQVSTEDFAMPDRRLDMLLTDILAVSKLQSDRTAWIQRFLVWSVYGVPLAIIGAIASLTALGMVGRRDALTSASALVPAFIALLCFGSLIILLQTIYPSFSPRKKPFMPAPPSDADLSRLHRRMIDQRRRR